MTGGAAVPATREKIDMYYWKITRDRIDSGAKGAEGPRDCDDSITDNPVRFATYDDDGECYHEGMLYGDYTGFEPLDDYGAAFGCTSIKIDGKSL